jgi:hypothetical protein
MDALQDFELNGRPLRISFAQARLTRPGNVAVNEGTPFSFDPHVNMRMNQGPIEMKRSSPMMVPGYAGAVPSMPYMPGMVGQGPQIRPQQQQQQPPYNNHVYGNPYVSNPTNMKWNPSNSYVPSQNSPSFNPNVGSNMYYSNANGRKAGPFSPPQSMQPQFNSNFQIPPNRNKLTDSFDHFSGNPNYIMNPDQMNGVSNTLTANINGNINNNNNKTYLFDSSNNAAFSSNLSNRESSEPMSHANVNGFVVSNPSGSATFIDKDFPSTK